MAEETVIRFNVRNALDALERLERKLRETGEEAENAFDKASESGESFLDAVEKAIRRVSPRLGGYIGEFRGLVAAYGAAGAAGAGLAAALGGIAANLLDLPGFLNDANEDLKNLNASFERLA